MAASPDKLTRQDLLNAYRRKDTGECSICGTYPASTEREHFPVLAEHGGKETWPLCCVCHDRVDRFPLDTWDVSEVWRSFAALWAKAETPERLLLVKMIKLSARAVDQLRAAGLIKYPQPIVPPEKPEKQPKAQKTWPSLPPWGLPISAQCPPRPAPEHTCALPPEPCSHEHLNGDPWLFGLATHSIRPTNA